MDAIGTLVLETERLILRPLTVEDAPAMYENWASSRTATQFLTWEPYSQIEPLVDRLKKLEADYQAKIIYDWAIVIKATGQLIGTITFGKISDDKQVAELGYVIGPNWWGNGYVVEAGKAIVRFGFERLGLHRIVAIHDINNPASGRVMAKLGMSYEGTMREAKLVKGHYVTIKQYALLASDFSDELEVREDI